MFNYAIHVLITLAITTTLKKRLARPRPSNPTADAPNKRYFNLRGHEINCSMPSGDTAQSAVFIGFCAYNIPLFYSFMGAFTFGLRHILMVAAARVFYHCHFIGDTFVGCFIGLFVAYLLYNFEVVIFCD